VDVILVEKSAVNCSCVVKDAFLAQL